MHFCHTLGMRAGDVGRSRKSRDGKPERAYMLHQAEECLRLPRSAKKRPFREQRTRKPREPNWSRFRSRSRHPRTYSPEECSTIFPSCPCQHNRLLPKPAIICEQALLNGTMTEPPVPLTNTLVHGETNPSRASNSSFAVWCARLARVSVVHGIQTPSFTIVHSHIRS